MIFPYFYAMEQLAFLPAGKRQEIGSILKTIVEVASPEKVILFGSHARGNWVEDHYIEDDTRYSYISDYDFLVVIRKGGEKEETIAAQITQRCRHYRNAVSPLVHDIDYINQGLRIGQYFFTEIIRDGIVLYDSGSAAFAEPRELTTEELRERSREYYDTWFPMGEDYLVFAELSLGRNRYKMGAFQLHQATEAFYATVLLVYTGYKPKSHNLEHLRNYAKYLSPELYRLFITPAEDAHQQHLFGLLKRGYIDARYKKGYAITGGELRQLIDRVALMKNLVEESCSDRI